MLPAKETFIVIIGDFISKNKIEEALTYLKDNIFRGPFYYDILSIEGIWRDLESANLRNSN